MDIPFARPSIGIEEELAVIKVLRSGWLTTGKESISLEKEFASFVDAKHALAVSSATAGLHLSLLACGVKSGDFVITSTYTFAATAHAISYIGAIPLFVDVDEGNWFTCYRQYAGENTTHGQLGGAFSEDGMDWTTYPNLNSNGNPPWGGGGVGGSGVGQARYPSAVGTEDMPIAMWNEYTGDTSTGSAYGGRPYYASDDFGMDLTECSAGFR